MLIKHVAFIACIVSIDRTTASVEHADATTVSGEYCHFETFSPTCRWKNEVIVIKTARYGRMKLGRCVSESTKLGCSADVLQIVSTKCSGKTECQIRVPSSDLEALKPCGEMWTYLEASYTCMKVVEDDRSCMVSVSSSEPVHIPAQTSTRCGTGRQRWQLDAPAGQRIVLSVLDFAPSSAMAMPSQQRPADGRCTARVYAYVVEKMPKSNVTVCERTAGDGPTSADTDGQGSFGDRQTDVVTSSNSAELVIIRDDKLANNFLIRAQATGCANIIPPEEAYLKRVDDHSVIVGCYETRQTWQLTCHGNQWSGTVGVCDSGTNERQHHGNNAVSGENSRSTGTDSQDDSEIFQIVAIIAVTSVGLAVCLTIICIGIYCLRRYPKKEENEGGNGSYHSILGENGQEHMSTKTGFTNTVSRQPQPVSSATGYHHFTPSGQYFALDPDYTNA